MAIDLGIFGRGNLATTLNAVNQRGAEAAPAANYDEIKAYLGTGSRNAVLRVKYGSSENAMHLGTERFGIRTFKGDRDALTVSVLKASVEAKFGNASYGAELERLLQRPRGGFTLNKASVERAMTALEAMHANGGVMPAAGNQVRAPDPNQVYTDQLLRAAGEAQNKYGNLRMGGQDLLSVLEQETSALEGFPADRQIVEMKKNPSLANQIFRNNDRLVEAGTDNPALTTRINALRATYLSDPKLAAMESYLAAALSNAADGSMFIFPTKNNTLMCIDYDNLDKILRLDVEDITIGVNEFRIVPKNADHPEGGFEAVALAADELNPAALYRQFEFMKGALTAASARNPDPSTRTADLLFGADPDFAIIIKSAMHGDYRPLTLDIVNDRIMPRIAATITNMPAMGTPNRWDEMELTAEHLASLRTAMTESGIENTNPNFAKYLFNLSAVYMNLSGTARLGYEGQSIIPLRAYAYVLMNAATQADDTVFHLGEIEGMGGYLEIGRADRCADVLSKNMMGTARAVDQEMFARVIHEAMASSAYAVDRPGEDARFERAFNVPDAGDRGISFLLRQSIVRDIDDSSELSSERNSVCDRGNNYLQNLIREMLLAENP